MQIILPSLNTLWNTAEVSTSLTNGKEFNVLDRNGHALMTVRDPDGVALNAQNNVSTAKVVLTGPTGDTVTVDNAGFGPRLKGAGSNSAHFEATGNSSTGVISIADPNVTVSAAPLAASGNPANLRLVGSEIVLNPSLTSTTPYLVVEPDHTGYGIQLSCNPPLNPQAPAGSSAGGITLLDGYKDGSGSALGAGIFLGTIYNSGSPISIFSQGIAGDTELSITIITGQGIQIGYLNVTNAKLESSSNMVTQGFTNTVPLANYNSGELLTVNSFFSFIDTVFPVGCL